MKHPPVIFTALVVFLAVYVTMRPDEKKEAAPPRVAEMKSRDREPRPDAAFWESAVVPEPWDFRIPTSVGSGARDVPVVDHRALVSGMLAAGDDVGLNLAVGGWYEADPKAARAWLASQPALERFGPAFARISAYLASAGQPSYALEWTALLPPGPLREQSLFDVYAAASRSHQFSEDELRQAPLPPERIQQLLSGVPGD